MQTQSSAPPGWDALLTPEGLDQLGQAEASLNTGLSSATVGQKFRAQGVEADRVSALLTQARLRTQARRKFGDRAGSMLFTQAGLEQATRSSISALHAARFAQVSCTRVADLGCGIGSESIAFKDLGITPIPVELDPFTAQIAEHNIGVPVTVADAETVSLDGIDGVFLDPARRTSGHTDTRRLGSPDDYSPSLSFAFSLASRFPLGIKLGPAFDRDRIPTETEAQWVSVDGALVEMGLWFGALTRPNITRSALVLNSGVTHELSAANDSPDAEIADLGSYLYEPDAAVIRARLIGLLAESLAATHISDGIAYLSSDQLTPTPFAQIFRILEQLPVREKDLRKALQARNIGNLEIKKRGADVDPAALRKRLRLVGPNSATLIMSRVNGKHVALLVERC